MIAALVVALAAAGAPAHAASGRRAPPVFGVTSARVTVDLVVRDKAGRLLRGLTADDVEIAEDGVRQRVESLDFVGHDPRDDAAAPPPAFVAVALDRLGPAADAAARAALRELFDGRLSPTTWVGVFSIDRGVRTLQHFTADRHELRAAVAGRSAATDFSGVRERDAVRSAYGGLAVGPGQAHVAAAELAAEPECRDAEDEVVRRLKILDSRMVEAFDVLERTEQGHASVRGLLALIAALERLPGRKALLLFSEGLVLPAAVEASFLSAITAANRAGVSVYAADMGGLRATSAADETRRALSSLQTRLRVQQGGDGPSARGVSAQDYNQSGLALLEKNEDLLRLDPASSLGRLAEGTGGFLIGDTNDVTTGLARVVEELDGYYLLSYVPARAPVDGRFRAITVKVKPPHGRLQARKGYLARAAASPAPEVPAVPAPGEDRLGAISLVLIGRAEKIEDGAGPDATTLVYGGVRLWPALGEPLSRRGRTPLAFYLTARPAAARPNLRVDVRLEGSGTVFGAERRELVADADGQARFVGTVPVEGLAPGAYRLVVTVADGRAQDTRTASVVIVP